MKCSQDFIQFLAELMNLQKLESLSILHLNERGKKFYIRAKLKDESQRNFQMSVGKKPLVEWNLWNFVEEKLNISEKNLAEEFHELQECSWHRLMRVKCFKLLFFSLHCNRKMI